MMYAMLGKTPRFVTLQVLTRLRPPFATRFRWTAPPPGLPTVGSRPWLCQLFEIGRRALSGVRALTNRGNYTYDCKSIASHRSVAAALSFVPRKIGSVGLMGGTAMRVLPCLGESGPRIASASGSASGSAER